MKALSRAVIRNFFPVKRLPGTPLPVVRTSNPMLSDSSIRRLMRQRNFPQRCRNQNAGLDGPMSRARLALRGRHRFPIGFSFFNPPKARLRQVASHGHFGFAMAAARFNPLVKSADMIVATALAIENRAVGSFHKGPLQIHIDISTNRSVVKFPPAGVLTRHQPAVASELLSTGETLHSPNLGPNHHCQDISHSRQTLKQVCFSAWSESLHHLRFDHFKILIDMIELPEHPSNCLFSIGRKLDQNSLHNRTSFFAKSITCLFNHKPVLRQGGMHTVFELCSLPTEHHARARQLPCIPNRRRGNPNRRQRSRPLQSVHPFGIELVAFVHTAHHQFRQPCINQLWFSSSLLNLIHYPIPVPHRLHRHRRLSFPPANKVLNAPMSVLQSTLVQLFSLCILYPCPGVLLVNIQCDVFHNCSPPRSLIVTTAVTEYLAFILIRMTLRYGLFAERKRCPTACRPIRIRANPASHRRPTLAIRIFTFLVRRSYSLFYRPMSTRPLPLR